MSRGSSTRSSATTCSTMANLVVAHAGLPENMQGRASGAVRAFALYGDTTGETDEYGLPIRYPWAQDYRGDAMVVYGHTPVPEPVWLNRDDLHRHRLCLRRPAHCPALPGERARLRAGTGGVLRAGETARGCQGRKVRAESRPTSTSKTSSASASSRPVCAARSPSARRTPLPLSR